MSVGLDIGSKSIKIVELVKDGDAFRLRASGIVGYRGIGPDKAKDEKELAPLVDAIKKLHHEAKISSKEVMISLPEPLVFTRTIKFPLLTDAEVASAVRWEAEQYIPIPIEEAVVQHKVIQRNENSSPPQVITLLVAAPQKLVETYSKVVEMAGLSLIAVETELLSISRSVAPADATSVVVDIGASSTDIALVNNKQLTLSRSIGTAGDALTRSVAQGLNVDEAQAEEYKRTYGMSDQLEGKIRKVMEPVIRVIADEVRKAVNYYRSDQQGEAPQSIILTGGTAGMPNVAITLAGMLGLEVVVGNPFASVGTDDQTRKTLAGYAPFYSIAVGLAMKEA